MVISSTITFWKPTAIVNLSNNDQNLRKRNVDPTSMNTSKMQTLDNSYHLNIEDHIRSSKRPKKKEPCSKIPFKTSKRDTATKAHYLLNIRLSAHLKENPLAPQAHVAQIPRTPTDAQQLLLLTQRTY